MHYLTQHMGNCSEASIRGNEFGTFVRNIQNLNWDSFLLHTHSCYKCINITDNSTNYSIFSLFLTLTRFFTTSQTVALYIFILKTVFTMSLECLVTLIRLLLVSTQFNFSDINVVCCFLFVIWSNCRVFPLKKIENLYESTLICMKYNKNWLIHVWTILRNTVRIVATCNLLYIIS